MRPRVDPVVMGVVNVTPDSFSDGGRYATTDSALAHGLRLLAEGADLLDVGGESTRPGATRPLVREEMGRVIPVVEGLVAAGARVSVDTMRADVAAAAIAAGAVLVNDVSGGLADPEILNVVADAECTYVAMHWRAHADHMADFARYDAPGGVIATVREELSARVDAALAAGIDPTRLVLDPGLGFAKRGEHNWALLRDLMHDPARDPTPDLAPDPTARVAETRAGALESLGFPLLVGASRKTFLGALLAEADNTPRPVDERESATTAVSVLLARAGVWGLRVHDVRSTRDALRVCAAMDQAREGGTS